MSTVNVFRYSALAAGIVYGAYHTSQLKSSAVQAEEKKAFASKTKLIEEAKAKYAELHKKSEVAKPIGEAKEVNFDDKDLDFAKVILAAVDGLKN